MMNNELLAKMLDGTLTDSERKILNSEAAAHPEFALELDQLRRIEAMLAKSGNRYDIPTPAFLQSVEDEIAQKVRDSRSVKPIPILPPYLFDTKFNWNLLIMACSGLVTIASLGYLGYNKLYPPEPIVIIEQTTPIQQAENIAIQNQQPTPKKHLEVRPSIAQSKQPISLLTSQNTLLPDRKIVSDNGSQQNYIPALTTKDSLDGSIAASYGSNTQLPKIQKMLAQLNEKRTSGDKIAEMSLNKKIGLLYNQDGNLTEARKYLEEALVLARHTNIREEEGNIMGEIGLIENKSGNPEKASVKIRQAIDILTTSGVSTARWAKELSSIHK